MDKYAFELGRQKNLCLAELLAVLGNEHLVEKNLDSTIFNLKDIEPQKLQNSLGGTIKIVKIVELIEKGEPKEARIKNTIEDLITQRLENASGKIPFSISTLNFKNPRAINIRELLNFSKKIIKSLGLNARFVNKGPISPPSSTIFKAKVIEKGIDIVLIKSDEGLYIGYSVSIQNIDDYTARDYDKPARDARVGMLPPKLAQIMINLAGDETKTVYDPFCGTGTVNIEAMLIGKDTIGSDIEEKLVQYSETNLSWAKKHFDLKTNYKLFTKDARLITTNDIPDNVDAVVTEGYLGPPQTTLPDEEKREKIFRELENLHLNWLCAMHKLTPKNCIVVMCVTAFNNNGKIIHMPHLENVVKTAGYKLKNSFVYNRQDQIVAREIVVLEKV